MKSRNSEHVCCRFWHIFHGIISVVSNLLRIPADLIYTVHMITLFITERIFLQLQQCKIFSTFTEVDS